MINHLKRLKKYAGMSLFHSLSILNEFWSQNATGSDLGAPTPYQKI